MKNQSEQMLEDVRSNTKIRLSALWVSLMFLYTYADVLGFYAPGNIEELISGEIAGIQITQPVLFGSAILMTAPSLMVFLSLVLKAKANRLVNIFVGVIYVVILGSTLLTGRNPAYYLFFTVVKALLLALIIWQAWQWPKTEA